MYTTSSLAPKNLLCNLLYSLVLFSFICQVEAEHPVEDSKALQDGRANMERAWEPERLQGIKPP